MLVRACAAHARKSLRGRKDLTKMVAEPWATHAAGTAAYFIGTISMPV
jgi:hypothetical protein